MAFALTNEALSEHIRHLHTRLSDLKSKLLEARYARMLNAPPGFNQAEFWAAQDSHCMMLLGAQAAVTKDINEAEEEMEERLMPELGELQLSPMCPRTLAKDFEKHRPMLKPGVGVGIGGAKKRKVGVPRRMGGMGKRIVTPTKKMKQEEQEWEKQEQEMQM